MKYILSLMLSLTALLSWGQCNIYFNVYDSYGDGWNGAGAEVFLNGESQGFLVLENGSEDLFSVSVDPGTYVQLLWTSGDYDDEISFDVLDEAGNVMWTGVFGDEVAQVVWTSCAFTADCLYYLETLDSYGDGWNGASLDIYINGWYNGTIDDPDLFDLWYFEAQVGDLIEFEWSSGDYDSEISFNLLDSGENLLYSGVFGDGVNQVTTATCGLAPAEEGCAYFLNVYDSWGDGWNGAYANVYIDGDFVGEAELLESDGDFAYYDVTLYPGEVFELEWVGGEADSEVYFSIMDADENVIYYGEWGDSVSQMATEDCDFGGQIYSDCEFTINLMDSYGDGWNGAEVDIYTDGIYWGTYDVTDGMIESWPIPVYEGQEIYLEWYSGDYDDEISFSIEGPSGAILYEGGFGDSVYALATSECELVIPEPCVYILNAYDTYGDGWEGAEIDLYISGAFAGNYTLNGDFEENEILLYPGEVLELDWYSGDYDDEVYVSLMTEDGILLDYAEHGDPLFFQAGPDCDADNEGINDCEVTITFYDSYNDGWNGAEVDIYTGGLFWGTFTLEDGLISVSNTFPIYQGQELFLDWYSGDYDDEISFELEDQNGNVFYTGVFGDAVNEVATDACGFGDVTTTFDCIQGSCTQLFDATGAYLTLADCQADCDNGGGDISFDCVAGSCTQLADATGAYLTLADCQANCTSTNLNEVESEASWVVYPNPANSWLTISTSLLGQTDMALYNSVGQQVMILTINQGETRIDIGEFNPGVYLLKHGEEMKRIVIQH